MANEEHLAILAKGVDIWNEWRSKNRGIKPDLKNANLERARLAKANFSITNLNHANLHRANLSQATFYNSDLGGAILREANLTEADLSAASLSNADLFGARLIKANLSENRRMLGGRGWGTILNRANLANADLSGANLNSAGFNDADLTDANLFSANLSNAILVGAKLTNANLSQAIMVETNLKKADLSGCNIYGIAAWNLKLEGAKQSNLIVSHDTEPRITVDNLEVAQFIYLLLHNTKIRDVIDTMTSKVVLILGRFTPERKAVLDALRDELRKRNYVPIIFDFDKPRSRDVTETVTLLARMARFIIADLTNPSSVGHELEAIAPHLAVPIQPLIEGSKRKFSMFKDHWKYPWVLEVHKYKALDKLIDSLAKEVIAPAEKKVKELELSRSKARL